LSGRDVFAGAGAGVEAFDFDLAEAGIVPNVGPTAALINPPKKRDHRKR